MVTEAVGTLHYMAPEALQPVMQRRSPPQQSTTGFAPPPVDKSDQNGVDNEPLLPTPRRGYSTSLDIYAFGVLIASVFSRGHVYAGMTQMEVLLGVLSGNLRPTLPPVLTNEVCLSCAIEMFYFFNFTIADIDGVVSHVLLSLPVPFVFANSVAPGSKSTTTHGSCGR